MNARTRTVKPTSFRLTKKDLLVLDQLQKHLGFSMRTETLRYVIRDYRRQVQKESDQALRPARLSKTRKNQVVRS